MLEDLSIRNGNIEMHLNGGIDMNLKDATLSVESRSLLGSSQLSGIRRSVNHLDFSLGNFRINDLSVQMDSIIYTGNNSKLNAGRVLVKNDDKSIDATASAVRMDEIFINELTGDVTIAGINWDKANINLAAIQKKEPARALLLSASPILMVRIQLFSMPVPVNQYLAISIIYPPLHSC